MDIQTVAVLNRVALKVGRTSHAVEGRGKMVGGSEPLLAFIKGLLSAFVFLLPPVLYGSFHKMLL